MTELQGKKLVASLIAAYPTSKITDDSAAVYTRMLLDLDYETASAAIARLVATSKFPPSIAEIREATLTLNVGEQRPGGEAWGEVLKAIGRYGYMRMPGADFQFDDPVVAECVAALKWRELCDSENQEADRARFIDLYDKLAGQQRRKQLSEGLPAMQRFRALLAASEQKRLTRTDEPMAIGSLLKLSAPGSEEA